MYFAAFPDSNLTLQIVPKTSVLSKNWLDLLPSVTPNVFDVIILGGLGLALSYLLFHGLEQTAV